jgi:hypothetical protein
MTVATVCRDRTIGRLDHAAITVRTAMGAVCRQLQAMADAVEVQPPESRDAVAGQIVSRGLASSSTVGASESPASRAAGRDIPVPIDARRQDSATGRR